MRAAKLLAVLAIAALAIGSFSAVAPAGKRGLEKARTYVLFADRPTVDENGKVSARGILASSSGSYRNPHHRGRICAPSRSMTLQLLDGNRVVLTTLDASTTGPHDGRGRWDLSGQLPTTLPAGTYYARVKAEKRTVGKFVCQADFSFMGVLGHWE